jgi:hypothetical protein
MTNSRTAGERAGRGVGSAAALLDAETGSRSADDLLDLLGGLEDPGHL